MLPFATIPHIIKTIGPEKYGVLSVATAINSYFIILADYGFNLSATKTVSVHRHNKEKLQEVYSVVMLIKIVILFISFAAIFLTLWLGVDQIEVWKIYIFTFFGVVGHALFPNWLFHGLETMKFATYVMVISKTLYTIGIFSFVDSKGDYILVPELYAASILLPAVWSFWYVNKMYGLVICRIPLKVFKTYMLDGWYTFVTRLYSNIYSSTNIILLDLFTDKSAVGNYAVAEKITQAISSVFTPLQQAFYPYLADIHEKSKQDFYQKFWGLTQIILVASVFLSSLALTMKNQLLRLVTGSVNEEVTSVLVLLLLSIIVSPFGAVFTNGMLIVNQGAVFEKTLRRSMLLNALIVVPLIKVLGSSGLALAYLIIQLFTVLTLYRLFKKLTTPAL